MGSGREGACPAIRHLWVLLPSIQRTHAQFQDLAGGGTPRPDVHRLPHQLHALLAIRELYSFSPVPQIKSAFFLRTKRAVVSASAPFLRWRSRFNSLISDFNSFISARDT